MKIEKFKLTKDNLLKVINLDKTFYHDKELTESWYFERFKSSYEGIGLFDNDNLVGYLITSPINKELYDEIKSGKYDNDIKFDPKFYEVESEYYYINSILILEPYRNKGYGLQMIKRLNPNKNYIAITVSKEGYYLAASYMNEVLKINDSTFIFTKEK